MGFLDKLKQVGHAITGGAADVTIELPETIVRGTPFTAKVIAVLDDQPLEIDGVYLLIRADSEVQIDPSNMAMRNRDTVELSTDGWEETDSVVDPNEQEYGSELKEELHVEYHDDRTLAAGKRYEWTLQVTLPADAHPSSYELHARHVWHIQAGLDAVGNDPDSGWIEFTVG